MNLTWQIVKKDARAMATPLAVWSILIAADLLLGAWASHGGASTWGDFDQLRIYHNLLQILQLGFTLAFTVELVQSDPTVGPKAFWRTRPISRPRLLCAKLISVALFFWLPPILLAVPWWLDSGLGAGDMASAAQEILIRQIAVTLPAMALASLTTSLARAIGTVIVGLLVISASPIVAGLAANLAGLPYRMILPPGLALSLTGWTMAGVILAGLIQFLTGRTRLSWIALGGVLAWTICSLVMGTVDPRFRPGWPQLSGYGNEWTFTPAINASKPAQSQKTPLTGPLPGVAFAISQTWLRRQNNPAPSGPVPANRRLPNADPTAVPTPVSFVHLQIMAQFARRQTTLVVEPMSYEMTLSWPPISGGGQLTRGQPFIESKANRQALIAAQLLFPDGTFALGPTEAAMFGDNPLFGSPTPPSLAGVLKFDVSRPTDVSEARLQDGARSGAQWRVTHWARMPDSVTQVFVRLTERFPEPASAPFDFFLDLGDHDRLQPSYGLANRAQGSFIAAPESVTERHLRISGVTIALRQLMFDARSQSTVADYHIDLWPIGPKPSLEDGWLTGTSVIRYSLQELGTIDVAAPPVTAEWDAATPPPPKD